MKRAGLLAVSVLMTFGLFAQEWVEGMQDPSVNVYEVQSQFEEYWEGVEEQARQTNENFRPGKTGPAFGFPQFKRWENFWIPRVSGSDGQRPDPNEVAETMFKATNGAALFQNAGDWQPIGPFDAPSNPGSWTGIGRINCIAFHPTNTNIIWAGAPAGGLWKSTNGGSSWSTNTDLLPNLGVSSIAIDPIHPDTMYIATGDRDAGDTYSYGVLKSVDGGQTWNTTDLSFGITQTTRVGAVHVVADSTNIIIVAARTGIFRSDDGGDTFNGMQAGTFNMLEPDPQNPNIIFAGTAGSQGRVWRSTDRGLTWTQLTTGLPLSGVNRVEVAISPQDSNYVYALYSASNNGFGGLYRSTDGGDTWTQRSTSPNILGWSANGTGGGGQGWYDLALDVDASDKNELYVGGVNVWRSGNGGSNWTCIGHWYGQNGLPTVHADIHYFAHQPGTGDLWIGTDGGVYKTTNDGGSFIPYKSGMNITQYYAISQSATNSTLIVGGAQDNGTHRQLGANWNIIRGGDGMDNGVDQDNNQILYTSVYYGDFNKSVNGGNTSFPMNIPVAGTGNWVTPFLIDPTNSNILYAGYDRLWRSTNKGVSWSATSSNSIGGQNIDVIAVAPANNQVLYVGVNEFLYRSGNNGSSWTAISQGLPGSSDITGIAISDIDPDHIWVSRTGYASNIKVFESTDAGQTWDNITGSLPNLPVNCIEFENGSFDGVYIGTDVGVYYRDATMNDWTPYMVGLPNVIVNDLEIYYPDSKIRAGTYGRGVWEASLFSDFFGAPEAEFNAIPYSTCSINDTVTLEDASLYGATNWSWSIYPSTFTYVNGTSDSSRNPQVVFSTIGEYAVTQTVSNSYGTDTKVKPRAISVGGLPLPYTEDFEDPSYMDQWQIVNPDGDKTWAPATIAGTSPGDQAIFMDFYNYTDVNEIDEFISPAFNFVGYTNISITFDHAYRRYNATKSDTLQVMISTDCGQTWTTLATYSENGNGNWATVADGTNAFTPSSAGEWCGALMNTACNSINLNAYANNNGVRIKFVARNSFGNNLYLDNINILGTPTVKPVADFIGDTAGCSVIDYTFYDVSTNSPSSWSWSFPGGNPSTSNVANPTVTYATGGTYNVTLQATNAAGTDTVVKSSYITVDQAVTPTAAIIATSTTVCDGEEILIYASSTNSGNNPTFVWYRNGIYETLGTDSLSINDAMNGDVFKAVMIPDLACVTNDSIVSNDVFISVLQLPNVTLAGFNQMCSADAPIVLTGGQPAGGTYSGTGVSNGLFDPSVAGVGGHIITYAYTDPTTGCANTAINNIIVNNAPPQPSVTYTNFVLKASPITTSYTYQWLDGQGNPIPGATDTVYVPTQTGDYSVEITFLNGCKNRSDIFTVTQIGLDEFTIESGFGLYPNPAKDAINVTFMLKGRADVSVSVLDMSGRRLMSEQSTLSAGEHSLTLDIDALPNGAYFIELSDGENQSQQRFIKQ